MKDESDSEERGVKKRKLSQGIISCKSKKLQKEARNFMKSNGKTLASCQALDPVLELSLLDMLGMF